MFGIKNTIEILNKKVNSAVLKLNEKEEEFISVRKTHDDNENILNKQNRLENETKYKIEMLKNAIENNSGLPFAVKKRFR